MAEPAGRPPDSERGGTWGSGVRQPRTPRAVCDVLGRLPRVGHRGVVLQPHQVVGPVSDSLAVDELAVHHVLPRLAPVGDRAGQGGRPVPGK